MKKAILFVALLLSGCATPGVNRADQNTMIKEFYASVESIKQVELSSEVKTGIVGGATIGVLDEIDGDHEDMIAGAIAGALVGGIFTALFEGSDVAFEYALHSKKEGAFAIIQKDKIELQSNCVKVRVAKHVLMQPAAKGKCN